MTSRRSEQQRRRLRWHGSQALRGELVTLAGAALAPVGIALVATSAAADLPHTGCSSVAVGQSSAGAVSTPGMPPATFRSWAR